MKNMQIEKIGTYFETDDNGYIINGASWDKIQAEWLPAVEKVKRAYIEHFKDTLHSIYIRGSVATGKAIQNISDIDSFAVVNVSRDEINTEWSKEFNKKIQKEYPFISRVEIKAISLSELTRAKGDQIMIKTQSICIYGENIARTLPSLRPGRDTAQHVKHIAREVDQTMDWLKAEHTEKAIETKCAWIMKRVVRSGCELVMERSRKYTRDLYPCYEVFSEYYPDMEEKMHEVLVRAVYPVSNSEEIVGILGNIGIWVGQEVGKVFTIEPV